DFCHLLLLVLLVHVVACLNSASDSNKRAFTHMLRHDFCSLAEHHAVNEVRFPLTVCTFETSVYRQCEVAYCCAALRISQFNILRKSSCECAIIYHYLFPFSFLGSNFSVTGATVGTSSLLNC